MKIFGNVCDGCSTNLCLECDFRVVAKKPHFSNFQGQNGPNVAENRQIIKNDYLRKRKTKKNTKRT